MKLQVTLPSVVAAVVFLALLAGCPNNGRSPTANAAQGGTPLTIAYSDWPGWLVWEIAIEKNFFSEAGVDVKMEWHDYTPSLAAFKSGEVDAVCMDCNDALVTGALGKRSVAIVLTDYSAGDDKIIGRKGIDSIKDLKGKKVGLERSLSLVEHILLDHALKQNGVTDADVTIVDVKTVDTPQTLQSGGVDAIAAWDPVASQALAQVPGSRVLYTSADAPGLIYDGLHVSHESLSGRRDDWKKVVGVWFRCLDYLNDPKTHADAIQIMAGRISARPEEVEKNLKGLHLLDREGNLKALEKRDTLDSVYGSLKNADTFYLEHDVYKKPQDVDSYVDGSLVKEVVGKK